MYKFKALLWKHWKERYRSFWHRLYEILSSLIIFIILVIAKLIHIQTRQSFGMEDHADADADVFYSPPNVLTWKLMRPICVPHHRTSESYETVTCHAMENEEQINNYVAKNASKMASITELIFNNLNGTSFPQNLDYTMKHLDTQYNRSASVFEDLYGGYIDDLPVNTRRASKFLTDIQWAIDKTFLSEISNQSIDHAIQLHDANDYMPVEMRVAHNFLMLCTILAPLPYFLHNCAMFAEEKHTGCNEMLKLYGVPMFYIRLTQFLVFTIEGAVQSLLITLVLKCVSVSNLPILPQSNPFIIWLTLVMHILIVTFLALVVSTLSQSHENADSLAILMYMTFILINSVLYRQKFKIETLKVFAFIMSPQAPVLLFWDEVFFLEEMSVGAQFVNMWIMNDDKSENLLVIWAMLYLQLFFLSLLAFYFDEITPGRYGKNVPWNFFLKKSYWKHTRYVHFDVTAEQEVLKDHRFYETPPVAPIAIKIVNLTKVFRNSREPVTALNNFSLDIYKGQVTVILGTNGAGKSTLMSVITGLHTATSGKVYIAGLDNSVRIRDCRKFLGYCPQQDFIFDYLTVKETILFFELVQGAPEKVREVNAASLMKHFQLADVAHEYSSDIAIGQRRCLQIACALLTNAKILVLDEPTTGMDYEMQHALWNLLLKFRGQKTILLSTSDMDEADALGDRIAVINKGHLKCNGSPTFLKNAMGTDFKVLLKLRDHDSFNKVEAALHKAFLGMSHTVAIKLLPHNKMCVNMPASEREAFPKVFDALEGHRMELGIENMHIGISLEHVFLRFIEEDDELAAYFDNEDDEEYEMLRGWALRCSQLRWLIKRVFKFITMHKIEFLVLQFLVPLVALIIVTLSCNMRIKQGLGYLHDADKSTALINSNMTPTLYARSGEMMPLSETLSNVTFVPSNDVKSDIYLQKSAVGYIIDKNHTDIYYRGDLSPESVNVFTNLYMLTGAFPNSSVKMTYIPLGNNKTTVMLNLPKNLYFCCMWSMWVGFLAILPLAPLILLCVYEYHRGVRFNHQMAGCPPYILWLSKLIAHLAIYMATVPPAVIICTAVLDYDQTLSRPNFLLALFLLLMAFGPAFLTYWYVMTFIMGKNKPIAKIYTLSICFGLVTPLFVYFVKKISVPPPAKFFLWLVLTVGHTLPTFTFSVALVSLTAKAHHNALCRLNQHLCPDKMVNRMFMTRKKCCDSDGEPFGYYIPEYYILIAQSVCFWTILILFQKRWIHRTKEYISNLMYRPPKLEDGKALTRVRAEAIYVREKIKALRKQKLEERQKAEHVVVVDNFHKRFGLRKEPVIKNVSLSCQRGQCLVLLGKGSSGKSVLLQLISGYTCITRGDCCVNGYFIKKDREKYIAELAYVRREGLDDFMTGYSNVEMIASLHGYRKHDAKRIAMRYLRSIGLTAYTNSLYESYSPGCGTRLAMCLPLLGSYKAVLLEKPYHFVDPHKRPLVTRAIQKLCDKNTACIVAETNMEWRFIDEFAHKLALLDAGEIVALGTAKEIKHEWASGYIAILKLKVDVAYHMDMPSTSKTAIPHKYSVIAVQSHSVVELKETFVEKFDTAVLTEEYLTILKYRIKDPARKIKYSEMFSKLESLKAEFNMIEDYSISEVSVLEILTQLQTHPGHRESLFS